MLTYLKKYWYLVALALFAIAVVVIYTNPAPVQKTIGKRATARTQARITKTQQQVAKDTLRRKEAVAASQQLYKTAQSAETRAQYLRSKTHAHAPARPLSDTAATRLTRILSTY